MKDHQPQQEQSCATVAAADDDDEVQALNDVLDAALDEFDDNEQDQDKQQQQPQALKPTSSSSSSSSPAVVMGPPRPPSPQITKNNNDNDDDEMMQQVMSMIMAMNKNGNSDEEEELAMMGQFLQHMKTQLKQEVQQMETKDKEATTTNTTTTNKTTNNDQAAAVAAACETINRPATSSETSYHNSNHEQETKRKTPTNKTDASPLDETIANLVESFAQNSMLHDKDGDKDDTKNNPWPAQEQQEEEEDAFLEQLLQGNPDALLEGMMQELMSKDLMYEPIKQVAIAFPAWIETNQDRLSSDELQQRRAQSRAFQRLATAYDQNPSDTKRLVNLMQDVQEYGQPPADLVHDIAPDLKLDAQGMPQFGQEDCRTM